MQKDIVLRAFLKKNMKLPELFEEKMRRLLGEDFSEYEKHLDDPAYYGIRVNTLKISVEDFLKICPFHVTKVPWTDNGFYVDREEKPSKHPYYHAGLYYIQEPSAMTPASYLPVEPGDRVLDLCGAPGGKSTELGAKLMGEGLLVSNDVSISRTKALIRNIEMFGIRNDMILCTEAKYLVPSMTGFFNKILIDAPCSGEGMFRKGNNEIKNWQQKGSEPYAKLQREIVDDAIKLLAPGGMLLYSTCTFSPEENEQVIEYLLEKNEDLSLVPMKMCEGFDPEIPYPEAFTKILTTGCSFARTILRRSKLSSSIRSNGRILTLVPMISFFSSLSRSLRLATTQISSSPLYFFEISRTNSFPIPEDAPVTNAIFLI